MASLEVIALDPTVPQLRAPGVSDTYHFCRYVEFQDGTSTDPSITNISDLNTGIYWPNADELGFTTGGVQRLSLGATTVFNETGADVDFRVEGDTDANLLFVDASTDRIGVGTASPAFKLDVAGTGKVSALYLTDMTAGAGALYYNTGAENRLTLANYNVGGTIFFETNGGAYAGAIDASQNWGIGTTTPNVRLDVNGAMRLRGSTSGYVGLQAAAVAGTTTYTLPSADGSNGQVLTTNGTGTLSWTTNAGGDVTGPASASDNAIARFDGTTGKLIQNSTVFVDDDGDVGIGTSTPGEKLQIESGTPRIYMNATTNSASAGMYFRVKDGSGNADNSGIYFEPTANIANRYINFSASNIGSDMAIRAGGNVGIGVITPDVKLRVDAVSPTRGIIETVRGTGSTGSQIAFSQDAVADWVIGQPAGVNAFAFWSGRNPSSDGTERMRLDSSGNLGLGVTPSAWNSYRALQLGGGGSLVSFGNAAEVWSNAFFNGTNNVYIANGFATRYHANNNGAHAWYNAPSGTAGNNITFTQAMTLQASGGLSVGTATDLGAGNIAIAAGKYLGFSSTAYMTPEDNVSGARIVTPGIIRFDAGGTTERARITAAGQLLVGTAAVATSDWFSTTPVGVFSADNNGQLRVHRPSAGNGVGAGAVMFAANDGSGNQKDVAVIRCETTAANADGGSLAFLTRPNSGSLTERARITSSGNFGINTTTPNLANISGTALSINNSSDAIFEINRAGARAYYVYVDGGSSRIAEFRNAAMTFYTNDTERARITSGGDFLVGTTSNIGAGARCAIYNAGGNVLHIQSGNAAANNFVSYNSAGSATATLTNGGALTISGALSKGSGSFRIDHPLKPDTHQLVHSFIEGPQADLIYRGKATLVNGKAVINIDEAAGMTEGTFVVLCREIQCFTSNESDWDAVRGSVSGNKLTIECQNSSSSAVVSWLVIGERQDKHMYETEWTDENGKVIVEPEKVKPVEAK